MIEEKDINLLALLPHMLPHRYEADTPTLQTELTTTANHVPWAKICYLYVHHS